MLNSIELNLCNMQGKLFELSIKEGYDSLNFIKSFMLSKVAFDIDKPFNHLQWAGENYIFDRLVEEESLKKDGTLYNIEVIYWIGYIYRYWTFYTGESSKEIYKQANAELMNSLYFVYHTMSPEMAIDRLKETYKEKNN